MRYAHRMLYRERIDEVCARLSFYVAYIKLLHDGAVTRREYATVPFYNGRGAQAERRKPYEALEETVERLEAIRMFYPTREQMQRSAYAFAYDAVAKACRYLGR